MLVCSVRAGFVAGVLLWTGLGSPSTAQIAKPLITWLEIDWEPAWINVGPMRGTGYAQTSARMIQERLTGYRHEPRRIANVRIYSSIRNSDSCFPASSYQGSDFSEEQRRGLIWSAPIFLFSYHGLIVHPQAVQRVRQYEEDGHIDLKRLLADKNLLGAYQPGRIYSRYLNDLFASDPNTKNLFRWSGRAQLTEGMFKMLDADRLDYFIDYYLTLRFHEESAEHFGYHNYFPILGHKGLFGLGAIACGDTEFGRQLIADINHVLADLRQQPDYIEANRRWLADLGQHELYDSLWRSEVLSRPE